jgi:hypothetical protein
MLSLRNLTGLVWTKAGVPATFETKSCVFIRALWRQQHTVNLSFDFWSLQALAKVLR